MAIRARAVQATRARAVQATGRYGPVIALDGASPDVPAGQLLGLLGPDGA